jgi:acetoacetate decarboxylase
MVDDIALPIHYQESDMMLAAWPADCERLQALTPAPLRVVCVGRGRAPLAVVGFDYRRSDAGAYGEVGIGWPVVHPAIARLGAPPVLPLLLERRWPGLGWWIHRLPVTTALADRAGRTLWGYPKFVADITFDWQDGTRRCTLAEGGRTILRLAIDTRMRARPQRFPMFTYSALGDELLRTRIEVDAVGRRAPGGRAALTLGDHPIAGELREVGVGLDRPLQVGWFPVWRAQLPAAAQRWTRPALTRVERSAA